MANSSDGTCSAQLMWAYQGLYLISIENLAERCFEQLAPGIFGRVFLIGTLNAEDEGVCRVCVEPEDTPYQPSVLEKITGLVPPRSEGISLRGAAGTADTVPAIEEKFLHRLNSGERREILLQFLQEEEEKTSEYKSFVALPVDVETYSVFICLQLNRTVYDSFHKMKAADNRSRRSAMPVSLIDALVDEYFRLIKQKLLANETGWSLVQTNIDELIKDAGSTFMYTISSRARNTPGIHGLFERLNFISSLKYESQENSGSIIICRINHPNIVFDVTLGSPVPMSDYRKVRKLLELTSDSFSLISDSASIYGLGHVTGDYNSASENLFYINFTGFYQWELLHEKKPLLNVKFNQPYLMTNVFKKMKFISDMKRIFKQIEYDHIISLYNMIYALIKSKYGSILVICSDAEEESERLKYQSIQVKPFAINDNMIEKFSHIDGAIIINEKGICYSISTILDGLATSKGDSSRGSRYNSSIRYFENRRNDTEIAIVIVSEDGMIDFIPYLRPVVSRKFLEELVNKLVKMEAREQVTGKLFHPLMEEIDSYAFYLNAEQCAVVNEKRRSIEQRLRGSNSEDSGQFMREDLVPNPECDDSYFV
ncbi:MAG: DNA integrity scanning protein DisA nucleotide-binding domain protein [Spirochaetaceae bacterium]|nr:DNA integrity scanning protein DisA nucleotide-binding domain protein [Spirochaetaceae bacterium]